MQVMNFADGDRRKMHGPESHNINASPNVGTRINSTSIYDVNKLTKSKIYV